MAEAANHEELVVLPFSGNTGSESYPVRECGGAAAPAHPAPPVVALPGDDAAPAGAVPDEYLPAPEDLLPVLPPGEDDTNPFVIDSSPAPVLSAEAPAPEAFADAGAAVPPAGDGFAVEPLEGAVSPAAGLPVLELDTPGEGSPAEQPSAAVFPAGPAPVTEVPPALALPEPRGEGRAAAAGFDDELARAGLAGLELELLHFSGKYLGVPFRVSSSFTIKGAAHAAPLLEKTRLVERCVERGIMPAREALVAVLKLFLAFNELERIFSLLALLPPPHCELAYYQALALYRAERMDEARHAAESALDWYRPEASVRYLLAAIHAVQGRPAPALEEARWAAGFFAMDRSFLRFYLQTARAAGDRGAEIEALQGLAALPGADTALRGEFAAALYAAERFEAAAPLYGQLLEDAGDRQENALRYAVCLAFTGGEERAAELLTVLYHLEDGLALPELLLHLVERGVQDPHLHALIGAGLLHRGDVEACRAFLDSLEGGLETPRVRLLKGECALLSRRHEEALALLQDGEWPEALAAERAFFSGVALHSLGRYNEAGELLRGIPAASARGAASRFYLGEIAYQAGRYRESVELLRQAWAGGYKKKQAIIRLAWAAFKADMLLVALDAFREVLLIDPDFIAAYNNLGVIYARQGLLEEAAAILKEGLRRAPEDRELHLNLSLVYERVLKQESREHFGRFLELRPAESGEREA